MTNDTLATIFEVAHRLAEPYHIPPKKITVTLADGSKIQFPIPAAHVATVPPVTTNRFAVPEPAINGHHSLAPSTNGNGQHNPGVNEAQTQANRCSHSEDFRAVIWWGRRYNLTPIQAEVVRQLWDRQEDEIPDVGQEELLRNAEAQSTRLSDVFRNSPAWGALVVTDGGGRYRLSRREEVQ